MWVAGTQIPRPSSTAFSCVLIGIWIGNGAVRTQTDAPVGCWQVRWWLNLLHYNAVPHSFNFWCFPQVSHVTSIFGKHFWFKDYLLNWKRVTRWERVGERFLSTDWFPQMPVVAKFTWGQSQVLRTPAWSPTWEESAQALGASSTAFSGALVGTWTVSKAARTWTSTPTWHTGAARGNVT